VCGQEGHLYYFNTRQDDKPEAAFFLPSYRLQVQVRALCGCVLYAVAVHLEECDVVKYNDRQ
jgi:hypothetical protein